MFAPLAPPAQAADAFAAVQHLQLAQDRKAFDAWTADLDGDRKLEVVISAAGRGADGLRELQVWRESGTAGTFAPGERLALTPDVVAWAVGDVREGGGDEIVLFNASGAFSWRPSGAPETRFERIAELEFLWQLPDPEQAFLWRDGVRDLDRDGLVDLVAPEPGGYAVLAQRRPRAAGGAWGELDRLRVPVELDQGGVWISASTREGPNLRGRRGERQVEIRVGMDPEDEEHEGPGVLVQVSESAPAPQWIDWDADGDLDLLGQTERHLHLWLQEPAGRFARDPTLSLALPVEAGRDRRLDASYSAHVADLDGDRRADCAIFAGDKRSEDVRTQGLLFTQAKAGPGPALFGEKGRPSDVLVFAGFVSSPSFRDLDGDGLPELSLRTVRPDLIDQLRSASTEAIDTDLYVYRNRQGKLSKQPDLAWSHPIPIERFQLAEIFCGDLTGDGLSELLVRDDPERLRVLMMRAVPGRGASGWTLVERPLWQIEVDPEAILELVEPAAPAKAGLPRAKPELLIVEPDQVLYVRFR